MEYTTLRASQCHTTVRYERPLCTMSQAEINAAAWAKFDKASMQNNARILAETAKLEAAMDRAIPQTKTVACECGHSVAASLVMNASRGPCCPACYDRLSD